MSRARVAYGQYEIHDYIFDFHNMVAYPTPKFRLSQYKRRGRDTAFRHYSLKWITMRTTKTGVVLWDNYDRRWRLAWEGKPQGQLVIEAYADYLMERDVLFSESKFK